MNFIKTNNIYAVAIVLTVAINASSWHCPFFWDTILTSSITQHFFTNGFGNFITPSSLDAGHPPLFYIYVTCFYHLFGKGLFAAHFSMLPFTIIGIISFIKLLRIFMFNAQHQIAGIILFFSIPAVITQYSLVSYDAVLLSLYLAVLAAFFNNRKVLIAIILIGIAGISLRGLFCLLSLSVTFFFLLEKNIKNWLKWNLYFLPSILLIAVWYYFHYLQTGWILSTKTAGWSEHRGFADAFHVFKNGVSIARCFFDLGIVILLMLSLFYLVQKRKIDNYTLLWLIPAIVFSLLFLPFTNPINHRYYLIVYTLMLFPVIQFLSGKKKGYAVLTVTILMLGNLQIYPVPISNGWDCTLAHRDYFPLRKNIDSIIQENIDRSKVGTVFPMNNSMYQTDMNEDTIRMINVNEQSIFSMPYVLYSNVGNDFSDKQINQLQYWNVVYKSSTGLVQMILYKNPKIIAE